MHATQAKRLIFPRSTPPPPISPNTHHSLLAGWDFLPHHNLSLDVGCSREYENLAMGFSSDEINPIRADSWVSKSFLEWDWCSDSISMLPKTEYLIKAGWVNETSKASNNSMIMQAQFGFVSVFVHFSGRIVCKTPILLSSIVLSFHRQLTLLANHFAHKC